MTNIMYAKEAHKESRYRKSVNEILAELSTSMKNAIRDGRYNTSVHISLNTPVKVREMLTEELKKKGYTVRITNNEKENEKMGSHSVDQGYYFDSITISWEK